MQGATNTEALSDEERREIIQRRANYMDDLRDDSVMQAQSQVGIQHQGCSTHTVWRRKPTIQRGG